MQLFIQIQLNLRELIVSSFIGYLRDTGLPRSLRKGSADLYTKQIIISFFFNKNSNGQRQQFEISRECACQIVKICSECPQFLILHDVVNPQGLVPNPL